MNVELKDAESDSPSCENECHVDLFAKLASYRKETCPFFMACMLILYFNFILFLFEFHNNMKVFAAVLRDHALIT